MNSIDLSPLYRNTIGFDRFASLLDNVLSAEATSVGYPPYNIESLEENRYAISLAVAGFPEDDIDITVEKGVLKVAGRKSDQQQRNYLHQGIANRSFERKFSLADHIEVTGASMSDGLLTIELKREIPEAMKPKKVAINRDRNVLEHGADKKSESGDQEAA